MLVWIAIILTIFISGHVEAVSILTTTKEACEAQRAAKMAEYSRDYESGRVLNVIWSNCDYDPRISRSV